MIKVKDVRVVSEQGFMFIEVNFKYQHKRRNKGFTYHIASSFVPLFRKYMRQIYPKAVEQGWLQFLRTAMFVASAVFKIQASIQLQSFMQLHAKSYRGHLTTTPVIPGVG